MELRLFLIDLYNKEIVDHSAGKSKATALVQHAFANIKYPLEKAKKFHIDRDLEFKNVEINELLSQHNIKRSLGNKGNLYDNVVSRQLLRN